MARAATTTDVFNAVAEAHRRQILDALVDGEASVGELVARLELAQPQVSKHLKVLAEVGLGHGGGSRRRTRARLGRGRGRRVVPVGRGGSAAAAGQRGTLNGNPV